MQKPSSTLQLLLSATLLLTLTACGKNSDDTTQEEIVPLTTSGSGSSSGELPDMIGTDSALSAVIGASEIPYPVYPNGKKYRVGGENGLKIVVYQTDDSFDQVDAYYNELSDDAGMPRLIAMSDYVRYSKSDEDQDPWATYRPGIVIHEFNDDGERAAVGADGSALTNIIMSF